MRLCAAHEALWRAERHQANARRTPAESAMCHRVGVATAELAAREQWLHGVDHGKTIRTAIDEGFRHAMPAIIDSNVSTILTAAVLYQFRLVAVEGRSERVDHLEQPVFAWR